MEVLLNGILSGMVLSLLIGPVFFTLIQTSVERGFKCGMLVAIGVSLSDSFYISIAYLGISQITENDHVKLYMAHAGGIMLMLFGLYHLFVKAKRVQTDEDLQHIKSRKPWRYVVKGFIINGLTPAVLLFWIVTVSAATTRFGYTSTGDIILFFAAIIATVLTTDILKAKLADKLRYLLTPKFIQRLNILMGLVLIVFGTRLLWYGDKLFPSI
jgi:threonine/homoserine/homoserine lactone efflux protein